ncbi:MAG: hypothetical protein C4330_06235 [Chitinophagaceae bacterium]
MLMVYGLSSSGTTVQFHYCCGKLKKIEFKPVEQTACKHGMHKMKNKKCCENKAVELKVKGDQKAEHTSSFKYFKSISEARTVSFVLVHEQYISRQLFPDAFAPPPQLSTPIFIMNCVYRI